MSATATHPLTVAEAAQIMREAVRDKSYRATAIGLEVGQFMRALRWQGASKNTLDTYETVLARLSLTYADFDSLERFAAPDGTELIREFLDEGWGGASAATRRNRLSILKSFFAWAVAEAHISFSPAAAIKGPRQHRPLRNAHTLGEVRAIISAQARIQDEVAILLMARLAFRKDDVRRFQVRDVDFAHDLVFIRKGKGTKPTEVPIAHEDVRQALVLWLSSERDAAEHLLYPKSAPERPLEASSIHRWWRRCLERAQIEPFPMHELRHSALHRLWEKTGNLLLVKQLARHASVATTEAYLHPSSEDLRAAMLESDRE